MDDLCKKWIADFERRATFSPESVYRHEQIGCEYIPIHYFADEPQKLHELGLKPLDYHAVDAKCCMNGDMTLIEVIVSAKTTTKPGLYVRKCSDDLQRKGIFAVIGKPFIERSDFEQIISLVIQCGFPHHNVFADSLGPQPRFIDLPDRLKPSEDQ